MANHRDDWTAAVTKGTLGASKLPQAKRSKYHAVKVTVDNITFDSKRESQRYHELKLMEKAGLIRGLTLQPVFKLTVERHDWQDFFPIVLGEYRADFSYDEKQPDGDGNGWLPIVEDVKGFDVPLGKWKRKHCEAQYGIQIRIIK